MNKLLAVTLVALTACSDPGVDRPGERGHTQSHLTTYCEFTLGQSPPGDLEATKTLVPTEGDNRIFANYRACQGRAAIVVELRERIVWSIRITGAGNCVDGPVCVGDSYRSSIERFPQARRILSLSEGKTFSLLVQDGLTLIFPAENLSEECFTQPHNCTERIEQSRVESILLYHR